MARPIGCALWTNPTLLNQLVTRDPHSHTQFLILMSIYLQIIAHHALKWKSEPLAKIFGYCYPFTPSIKLKYLFHLSLLMHLIMIEIFLHPSVRISGYLFDNSSPRHDAEVTESRQYPPKIRLPYRKTS